MLSSLLYRPARGGRLRMSRSSSPEAYKMELRDLFLNIILRHSSHLTDQITRSQHEGYTLPDFTCSGSHWLSSRCRQHCVQCCKNHPLQICKIISRPIRYFRTGADILKGQLCKSGDWLTQGKLANSSGSLLFFCEVHRYSGNCYPHGENNQHAWSSHYNPDRRHDCPDRDGQQRHESSPGWPPVFYDQLSKQHPQW
jgi:hypothetical protein